MTRHRIRFAAALAALAALCAPGRGAASPAPPTVSEQVQAFAPFVVEAAARFGLPGHWIAEVLRAESAGDPRAVSSAGAMGLMQLMPATWAALQVRLRLGDDPFDPRDNILAGAAYLRDLYDRYGRAGFLAAYNAGPGRYEAHLRDGRPLPAETRAYLANLAPWLADPAAMSPAADPSAWRRAPVFVARAANPSDPPAAGVSEAAEARPPIGSHPEPTPRDGLFVRVSGPRATASR